MFRRLKEKWNVGWFRFILIFTTFALGGSLCGYLGRKLLLLMDIDSTVIRIPLYIIIVTLLWPFCVLLISIPLGQFNFFRSYLAKMGRRMSGRKSAGSTISPGNIQLELADVRSEDDKTNASDPNAKSGVKHIAIFASGAGTNAKKIIEHFNGSTVAAVALIVCNNPKAGVLKIAADNNIPVMMINRKGFYEEKRCLEELALHQVDLVVLAGFLWMIPQYLVDAFPNAIVNIHPALLPKYGGKGMYGENVHQAVIAAGEKESGITIHYVDEHYDNGDVILQAKCPVMEDDTPTSLAERIHLLEHEHYARVIEELLK